MSRVSAWSRVTAHTTFSTPLMSVRIGNRIYFFSKDMRALLVYADPLQPNLQESEK